MRQYTGTKEELNGLEVEMAKSMMPLQQFLLSWAQIVVVMEGVRGSVDL